MTLRRWLPFLLFAACYAAALITLERAHVLLYSTHWPFLLTPLLPLTWWQHLRGRQDLGPFRALTVSLLRLTLLGTLIAALTEPRSVRTDPRLSIVFALDHSASIQDAAGDTALRYVLTAAQKKPDQDEAGLVFFGRRAAVELPPSQALPFESINVAVDRDGTSISEALSLSAALLPQDRLGRIVMISDGVSTEGSLPPVLDDLRSRGIAVDVLPVEYTSEREVWLDKLELPKSIKLGETIEPAVVLSALQAGEGVLTLEARGQVVVERKVKFAAGKSRFSLPTIIEEPGYYEFKATITLPAGQDRFARNNVALASVHLAGKGKVLLVVDSRGDRRDHEHLAQALLEAQREVVVIHGEAFPRDPMELLPYDSIVFVNAGRDAFDEAQMQAANDAVFHQGSGFLMLGGQNGFGPGGYHKTPIEQLLPVDMDISQKKVMPKGALAIILHTCEFAQGNTWAKRITLQAIKVLQPGDEVGVIVYVQGGEKWIFPLTLAAEYEKLVPLVNNCNPGDMPGFGPTMQMALSGLQASDASTKHVIIISDGDPGAPVPALVTAYRAAKVSVSTVTVFPHGNVDRQTMNEISRATGGRHYQPSAPEALPAIFIKEAKTLRRSAVENKTFTPTAQVPSRILEGIDQIPQLHGYVLTTPKPRSQTILEGPDAEDEDPVLIRWRYGIGVAAAFTSDLGANWGKDWVAWARYRAFVSQLMTDISRVDKLGRLVVSCQAVFGEGWLRVEDHGQKDELLDLMALIDGPGGERSLKLEQVAPRRYEARFPLQGVGRYRAIVTTAGGSAGAGQERAFAGFAVPFSQEYLRFRSDPQALRDIATRTGGRVLRGDDAEQVYPTERTPKLVSRPIGDWLLAVLAALLVLEVAFRRLHVDWSAFGRLLKGEAPAQETLDSLLAKKQAVSQRMATTRRVATVEPPPLHPSPPLPPLPRPPHALPPEPAPREAAASAPLTTTERLLAAKRRAQKQPEPPTQPDLKP